MLRSRSEDPVLPAQTQQTTNGFTAPVEIIPHDDFNPIPLENLSSEIPGDDIENEEDPNEMPLSDDEPEPEFVTQLREEPSGIETTLCQRYQGNAAATKILDDVFHFMDQLLRLLSKKHSVFKDFAHHFSEAIFIRDKDDEDAVRAVIAKKGGKWSYMNDWKIKLELNNILPLGEHLDSKWVREDPAVATIQELTGPSTPPALPAVAYDPQQLRMPRNLARKTPKLRPPNRRNPICENPARRLAGPDPCLRVAPPRAIGLPARPARPPGRLPTTPGLAAADFLPETKSCAAPPSLSKIFEQIDSGPDRRSLRAQRQSLLWIALTCKSVSLTAIKYLWRRLDNALPLLLLLPTFTEKNGKYGLFGASHPHEWTSFDHHATYVKEVVYEDIASSIHIDPAVYLRLILRNPSVLPNLRRFSCRTTVRPSESELLVYLQSPIRVLELGTFEAGTLHSGDTRSMAATRDAVVSCLSANPSHITHLVLVDQPFSLLSELGGHGQGDLAPLKHLISLEFRAMYGVMDATLLRQIGTLPQLRSFTADSGCFTGLNLSNIASRLTRPPPLAFGSGANNAPPPPSSNNDGHGLFRQLTHLALERHPSMPHATISSFLQLISSSRLRFVSLTVRPARKAPSPRGGAHAGVTPSHADLQSDPLYVLAQRWARSLLSLEVEVDHNHVTLTNFLRHVPGLRRLILSGYLHVPDDTEFVSAFTSLTLLECLALRLKTGMPSGDSPPTYAPIALDMHALTRLVRVCPRLRELETAVVPPSSSPPSSTWPVSQNLRKMLVHADSVTSAHNHDTFPLSPVGGHGRTPSVWSSSVWSSGSGDGLAMSPNAVLALARYLDRLFPRLNTVRYVCAGATEASSRVSLGASLGGLSTELEEAPAQTAWAQVQDLVFAFQDVRRGG
ncbi:hypothetical protein MSAN_00829200 [Mycena sanguinolenta]|uniref:Uncharacterized protein n=1 Tax=Mycena sanguinolenta TaxID=230812 RepID=A0A8H6Z1K5_9AGAR|nr:hypothetical protein MSAN_00829200 [Mycena sanguinolenta]